MQVKYIYDLRYSVLYVIPYFIEARDVCEFFNPEDWNEDEMVHPEVNYKELDAADENIKEHDDEEELKDRIQIDEYAKNPVQPIQFMNNIPDNPLSRQDSNNQKSEEYKHQDINRGWRQPYGGAKPNGYNHERPRYSEEQLKPNGIDRHIAKEHHEIAQNLAKKKGTKICPIFDRP